MNTNPEPTEEEVLRSMNFDKVLSQVTHEGQVRERIRKRLLVSLFSAAIGVAAIGIYALREKRTLAADTAPNSVTLSKDTIVETMRSREIIVLKKEVPKSLGRVQQKPVQSTPPVNNIDRTVVTEAPYVPAEPVNGFPDLYEYLNRELKYPDAAIGDAPEGVETIQFNVDESGQIVNIVVLHSIHPDCDKEAIRLIEKLPAWKPATLDGKPVSSKITLPITFSLQSIRK